MEKQFRKTWCSVLKGSRNLLGVAALVLSFLFFANEASTDTGVSDERVVLPDGPGSIGGVGENADIDPNMGLMRYGVNIDIPPGFPGLTPKIRLSYSSSSGASILGVGWSMTTPYIERMSLRGLPEYTADDELVVNGSEELILVAEDQAVDTRVYRTRFEKEFARYTWHDVGDGSAGYLTAEYPDGTVGYFGADQDGALVTAARVEDADGRAFRYHLVEKVDPFGHRISYRYVKSGDVSLVDTIGYVYTAPNTPEDPRFSVRFAYEDRQDAISTCVPGYNLLLTQRLNEIVIYSSDAVIRRYELTYEDYETSGGFSRLARVQQFGLNDVLHEIQFSFGYSRTLGASCAAEAGCESPYLVDMGTLSGGVDFRTGRATLLDINGDALPDVLHTTDVGEHFFYISELDVDNMVRFSPDVVESASTIGGSDFILNAPGVQVLDVNGDGFTDIISARNGTVLCNTGAGDWNGSNCLADSSFSVTLEDDPDETGEADPLHVRFMDYNNDKRIDMLRTTSTDATQVHANTGTGFTAIDVQVIGAAFDESNLQLTDMNGDGLQDPVEILGGGQIRYRLNLGFGNWDEWTTITLQDIDATQLLEAKLEDLNGDGLSDIVVVIGNEVKFSINRNGDSFDPFVSMTSADIDGDMPEKTSETMVLFADMNGSGSRDIVWITSNGNVRFLELFPVKPNLLSRIENGIGSVQVIEYGTSVVEQARDKETDPWMYHLPHAMNVVVAADTWVTLTGDENGVGLHERVEYRYHNGFYDGEEKTFRGYADVELHQLADPNLDRQEAGLTVFDFDVGADDVYFNGKLLQQQAFAVDGDATEPLNRQINTYDDCEVAEIPNAPRLPIRYICKTAAETVIQERAPEEEWATLRTELEYDGYGNVIKESDLGVVHRGSPESPAACDACSRPAGVFGAPCGADCLGDESYTETAYVMPGESTKDAWFLHKPYQVVSYAEEGGAFKETLTYYDGDAFVGLPQGELQKGLVSRVTQRVNENGDVIPLTRSRHDAHGNVIEALDPNGDPDDTTGHRRAITWDAWGLKATSVEIYLQNEEGNAYTLRRDITYEPTFNQPSEATQWMVMEGADPVTSRNSTRFRYDDFARPISLIRPGDDEDAPTLQFTYELGDPASRVSVLARSQTGGSQDIETIKCLDGKGREYQTRTRLSSGSYQVSGFTEFNKRGAKVRVFQPYLGDTGSCDTAPPAEGVLYTSYRYDALYRDIQTTLPDSGIYDTPSIGTTVYSPLMVSRFDEEDNDDTSQAYNTPLVERLDGLGRMVAIDRYLEDIDQGGDPAVLTLLYNEVGQLAGYIDADGNQKDMIYDLADRIIEVRDPNSGNTALEYDDAGNVISSTDARGVTTMFSYDGINRKSGSWEAGNRAATLVEWMYDYSQACDDCRNGAGQLVRTTYPLGADRGQGIDETGYDARSRRMFARRTLEGIAFTTEFAYDNFDRMIGITQPDGTQIDLQIDDAGRLTGIQGILDNIDYEERGMVSLVEYANGVVNEQTYDDVMRLDTFANTAPDDTVLQGFTFSRDRVGNIVAVTDTSSSRADRPAFGEDVQYDAWYRVLVDTLDAGGAAEEILRYSYDLIDNILSKTSSLGNASRAHVGDYTYSASKPNAVTAAGDISLSYDAAGRVVERGSRSFTWDHMGRLSSVDGTGEDDIEGEFVYGPEEERVMKLERGGVIYYVHHDFEVRDGISVTYARHDRQRVARLQDDSLSTEVLADLAPDGDPDGVITAADAWIAQVEGGTGSSSPERLLRGAARRLLFDEGANRAYLQHDDLGSIIMATDPNGELIAEKAYYPNGELRFDGGYVDNYGFTGQERDESTGLVHFKHRYLDTEIARWVSTDPLFLTVDSESIKKLGESTTAYAYVANNAVNHYDPTGLENGKDKKTKTTKKSDRKAKREAKKTARKAKKEKRKREKQQAKEKKKQARETKAKEKAEKRIQKREDKLKKVGEDAAGKYSNKEHQEMARKQAIEKQIEKDSKSKWDKFNESKGAKIANWGFTKLGESATIIGTIIALIEFSDNSPQEVKVVE